MPNKILSGSEGIKATFPSIQTSSTYLKNEIEIFSLYFLKKRKVKLLIACSNKF